MTNPNDIIDAYDELRRLATILDPDDLRTLVDRAIGRPRTLQIVGEQGPEPVTLATGGLIDTRFTVLQGEPGRVIGDIEVLEVGTPPVGNDKTDINTEPVSGDGCPWCTADVRPRLLWRHLNSAHREDLHELYAEDGTKGLQDTFGIAYQTAYGWGQRITGEAA